MMRIMWLLLFWRLGRLIEGQLLLYGLTRFFHEILLCRSNFGSANTGCFDMGYFNYTPWLEGYSRSMIRVYDKLNWAV